MWRRSCNSYVSLFHLPIARDPSDASQTWIARRTCFARSIATTSMVGAIIGLGDRHPANTLIEQTKFNAISIDFGVVFDAAQKRKFYPEKVPFRLTPQIWTAFELAARQPSPVPGSRGHFKQSSTITMGVLRKAKDTLLAMLEAFAYDPLLIWRGKDEEEPKGELRNAVAKKGGRKHAATLQDDVLMTKTRRASSISRRRAPARTEIAIDLGGSFIAPGSVHQPDIGPTDAVLEDDDSIDRELSVARRNAASLAQIAQPMDAPNSNSKLASSSNSVPRSDPYVAKMATTMTNKRALEVLTAIERRLSGHEYADETTGHPQEVEEYVQRLIEEATKPENLAQGYVIGWQPAW